MLRSDELVLKGKGHTFAASDLSGFRLVVLNHFSAGDFKEGQVQALLDYVQRGEGALLVLGTAFEDVEDLFASDLARVLPVGRPEGRWESPKRLNLVLTPQGMRHPSCVVLPHPQANLLAWKNLPPVLPGAVIPVQAGDVTGSTVLASYPYYPRDLVGIAYRFFGRGLTVYLNTFESHLLRLLPAAADDRDQVYVTFVANLLDWMTDAARGAGVAMTLPRLRYSQGETVEMAVNDYQGMLPPGDVLITVTRDEGEKTATIKLARNEDGIAGSFTPELPGIYTLSLPVPGKSPVEKRLLVQEDCRELDQPFANLQALKEIGVESAGAYFDESDPAFSRVALDATPLARTVPSSVLWIDEWKLMALLMLLVTTEWIARRRRNLV
ncbi:MAG: hypothetical protein HY815_21550 [Candidatus Riflebacteria bacterium]|nr:hypothetical protein [Candidatus Riflebacteria bacterium]